MSEISSLVQEEISKNHSLPFIALTETWLKSYISDAQLHVPGYLVSRSDRDTRVGGGVLLYSHINIPVSKVEKFDDGFCQGLFCQFSTIKTCVAVGYRPPNADSSSFSSLLRFFSQCKEDINDDSYDFCFTGDLNLPAIDWQTNIILSGGSRDTQQSAALLLSFMSEHLLSQYVLKPTRDGNILDIFLTNNDRLVANVESNVTTMSDHNIVDVMLSWNPLSPEESSIPKFDENSFRSLDFHKADFDVLRTKFSEVDWFTLRRQCTFEEFPVLFTDTLFQICASSVPVKKVSSGRPKHVNALRRKRNRQKARLQALIDNDASPEHIRNVRNKVALLQYDIKEACVQKLEGKEQKAVEKIKKNPKYFYSYAKSLSKIKASINMLYDRNEEITTDPKKMANLLQEQFSSVFSDPTCPDVKEPDFPPATISKPSSLDDFIITEEDIVTAIVKIPSDSASGPDGVPVTLLKNCARELCCPIKLIWTESFYSSTVPQFYKDTHISPLFKKGDRARAVNYRPVALTSHIIKIYERILRNVMVKFIDENKLLCDNQHGFRSGRSCLTQLLSHVDDIVQGLTNSVDVDAIYLDFAKAFDKVDHRLLLLKMKRLGFHEKVIKWVESFLSNRKQSVCLNGISSFAVLILSGVPQGTVLGPLLFIIFIDDMRLCIKGSIIRFFADDTRILKHISCMQDSAILQSDLSSVIEWAKINNMALHEDKFELVIHKHNPQSTLFDFPFATECQTYEVSNGNLLHPVEKVKDLGVTLSSDLTWGSHINTIALRARKVAAWVLSAFKTRNRLTMLTLYKSLVRSHLEYCCPLWNSCKSSETQLLEGVQRTFTSKIWGFQHLNYWQRLKALDIMSLQRRRERYIIIHMWKILHGVCPNGLNVQFYLPSRLGTKAIIPCLSKSSSQHNQTLYDTSFAVMGPRLWNIIPGKLHSVESLVQFKTNLKVFMKTFPDEPPINGYICRNGNSLLEWNENRAASELHGRSTSSMTL